MTNPTGDDSKTRRTVSPEAFAKFLEFLSTDTEEAARRYMRLHEKLVGFFNMKGISDSPGAADETIDRAVIKMAAGTPVSDVNHYCSGIARNLAKERLRQMQRENSAFRNFIEHLANSSEEQVERIYHILKPCFDQLASEEQNLLVAYCQVIRGSARIVHRRRLAETMQTTMLALRMRVTRLRKTLTDCVRKSSN
jgi:predicted transcriptional regulator of viral defense system